jgi:hypothetical protein
MSESEIFWLCRRAFQCSIGREGCFHSKPHKHYHDCRKSYCGYTCENVSCTTLAHKLDLILGVVPRYEKETESQAG